MLLCPVNDEGVVDLAGDVALEAADDLGLAEPFGGASAGVGAGGFVVLESDDRGRAGTALASF